MPKVRRKLPPRLLEHLRLRMEEREITAAQMSMLAMWLAHDPDVPEGRWFKRFPGMTVCGEGELIKTFLRVGQVADGEEVA